MNILHFLTNPFAGVVVGLFAFAAWAIYDSVKSLWSNEELPEFADA